MASDPGTALSDRRTSMQVLTLVTTQVLGGGSLLLFGVFMWHGSLGLFDMSLRPSQAIAVNLFISLVFFAQHSIMVRPQVRRLLPVPKTHHGVLYSIVSGVALLAVIALWQSVPPMVLTIQGASRFVLRCAFVAAVLLFVWSIRSIRRFDGFGVRALRGAAAKSLHEPRPLTIRGPYRWVRHPLYTGVLVMIWSGPDVTVDRLLFNLTWTAWMVLATRWEEKDLVADFGEDYQTYQQQVPMLLPWRRPPDR